MNIDIERFKEAASRASPPASGVMFEMIELLEQMEKHGQEPVGYVYSDLSSGDCVKSASLPRDIPNGTALYLAPPAPPSDKRDAERWRAFIHGVDIGYANIIDLMDSEYIDLSYFPKIITDVVDDAIDAARGEGK